MSKKAPVFTPEAIMRDAEFSARKDALGVVLTGEQYTLEEAKAALSAFMERGAE